MKTLTFKVGLSRAEIYRRMKLGKFPAANVVLGERAKGWTSDVIDAWITEQRTD